MLITERTRVEARSDVERMTSGGGAAALAATEADRLPLAAAELDSLVRIVAGRIAADAAVIAFREEDGEGISVCSSWGSPADVRALMSNGSNGSNGSDGFVGRVLASDVAIVERLPTSPVDGAGPASPIDFALGAPIRPATITGGALCAGLAGYPPAIGRSTTRIASYAAIAQLMVDDPDTAREVLQSAYRDGLTGCLTYTALLAALEHEVRRSERYGQALSCCFVDLDGFKRINDSFGHAFGNRVLVAASGALRGRVRSVDVVGRYGGDEFVVIVPSTDMASALALAENLKDGIRAATTALTNVAVDASIGVAEWSPGVCAEELLGHADDALRRVKSAEAAAR
jgi:diguanylate cyclase (GGDEF)-like protein